MGLLGAREAPLGRSGLGSYLHSTYGQVAWFLPAQCLWPSSSVLGPERSAETQPCAMERGHCEQGQGANTFPLAVTSVEPLSCLRKTGLPV